MMHLGRIKPDTRATLGTGDKVGVAALFGALAEISENTIEVLVSACSVCGHLEFRASTRA